MRGSRRFRKNCRSRPAARAAENGRTPFQVDGKRPETVPLSAGRSNGALLSAPLPPRAQVARKPVATGIRAARNAGHVASRSPMASAHATLTSSTREVMVSVKTTHVIEQAKQAPDRHIAALLQSPHVDGDRRVIHERLLELRIGRRGFELHVDLLKCEPRADSCAPRRCADPVACGRYPRCCRRGQCCRACRRGGSRRCWGHRLYRA